MIYSKLINSTLVLLGVCTFSFAQVATLETAATPPCEDSIEATATIDPDLASAFFEKTIKSYPSHIIDHGNGRLEDTTDGVVDPEDLIQIEHTANCVSSHQGKHTMEFCDASSNGETISLKFWGALPAYASSLSLTIAEDLSVNCFFESSYPAPSKGLSWRITNKTVILRNQNVKAGDRLFGWLSVEFEERSEENGKVVWTPHKIEGHFKARMLMETAPNNLGREQKDAKQVAATQEPKPQTQQSLYDAATVVIRALVKKQGEGSKYYWVEVLNHATLKAPKGTKIPRELMVAYQSMGQGLPTGHATLYLGYYNPEKPESGWKLVEKYDSLTERLSQGYSHHTMVEQLGEAKD